MTELLPYFRDMGFLLFGCIGAWFSYRSWRQREDEIKEKYFDRRYALYCMVDEAVAEATNPAKAEEYEWWKRLIDAKRKSNFLVDSRAQESIGRLQSLAVDYAAALEESDTGSRVKAAKVARDELQAEFQVFVGEMKRYILVA